MSLVRLLNRAAESSSDGHSSSARASSSAALHGGFGGHGARCEGLERVLERGVLWKRTNTETFGRSRLFIPDEHVVVGARDGAQHGVPARP